MAGVLNRAADHWPCLVLAGLMTVMVLHAHHLACVAEDAFISFRFARHLADGHGLVWNIGEPPVEGYTNFLWVILLAGALKLGLNPGGTAQVVGVLATAVTMAYLLRAARVIRGSKPGVGGLVAPALMAASGPVATWATSGMETNLFGALVFAAFVHHVEGVRRGRLSPAVPVLLFLAALTRPEGVLFFALLWGHTVYRLGKEPTRREERADFGVWTALFAVPGFIYFLWRYHYFGYLLPNTFYAKTGGGVAQVARGAGYLWLFVRIYLAPVLLLVLTWGGWLVFRRARRRRGGEPAETRLAAQAATGEVPGAARGESGIGWQGQAALLVLGYLGYLVWVGGDYMAMFRFLVPILPLVYLLIQEGWAGLYRRVNRPCRWWLTVWLAVMLVYTGFPSMTRARMEALGFPAWVVRFYRKPSHMHGYADGVALERWHATRLALLGKFFHVYARSPDDSVLTNAIGAIGYYSGIRVYGEHGLVDTHIAHLDAPFLGRGLPGHEKGDYAYLLAKRPTFVMINRGLTRQPAPRATLVRTRPPWVQKHLEDYVAVSILMRDRENQEVGYFNFLVLRGHVRKMATRVFDPGG